MEMIEVITCIGRTDKVLIDCEKIRLEEKGNKQVVQAAGQRSKKGKAADLVM